MKPWEKLRHRQNGDQEVEHPKPIVELIANTREAVEGYRATTDMSFQDAALVLIFNELRCMHWHFDDALSKEQVALKGQTGEKD